MSSECTPMSPGCRVMSPGCLALAFGVALALAASAAGQVPAPAPGYDPNPKVVRQGLTEIFRRRPYVHTRTMDALAKEGTCPGELLIYNDVDTGAEVWRLTWRTGYNTIHSHINRTPWTADGSLLGFRSDRGMPGVWKRAETGRGDPHPYLMQPDGSSFKLFGPTAPGFTTVYGRWLSWDKRDPDVCYWPTHAALYRTVATREGVKVEKVVDLPNADRRKDILANLSESNLILIKDRNSSDYRGEVYVVDPAEGKIIHRYEWGLGLEWPKHDVAMEFGFHDCTFRRNTENTYVINYGPGGSVGESLFFEIPLDGDRRKVKICYPNAADPNIPYYSHPAWSATGKFVAYFGCEEFGPEERNPGLHVRDHDARKPIVRLIDGWVGGHIAWDGYDEDWLAAAVGSRHVPEWDGWIAHAHIPTGRAEKLTRHHSRENGGQSNYAAYARPAQSPDGTKCLFHSTMLQTTDQSMDLYIAVSHRPAPPTVTGMRHQELEREDGGVIVEGVLAWKPPKMHREIKAYCVYRRRQGETAWNIWNIVGKDRREVSVPFPEAQGADYCVTSIEHSGLESSRTSAVGRVKGADYEVVDKAGLTGWDKTPPEPPADLKVEATQAGPKLTWRHSTSKDVRYVNVYFSATGVPAPVQANRIASVIRRAEDPTGLVPLFPSNEYIDWSAPEGVRGTYAVTAVDRQGNESAAGRAAE